MIQTKPLIIGPDGAYADRLRYSTTIDRQFLRGTVPSSTVDVQVSINGSGYSADPSLVLLTGSNWIVPNPSYEPDGLLLRAGVNTILIRGILSNGSVTTEIEALVTLASDKDIGVVAASPTNITVTQNNYFVGISAEVGEDVLGFQGLNFYASVSPGGGGTGYARINVNPVTEGVVEEEEDQFASFRVNSRIALDPNGNPVADPLFVQTVSVQADSGGTVQQVDYDNTAEVPEVARDIVFTGTYSTVREVTRYIFNHSRSGSPTSDPPTVRNASFSSIPVEDNLYYVVSATYYDATRNLQYESALSEEVVGRPLKVTGAMISLPAPSKKNIVTDFITNIFRTNPQIRVEAGSVIRDTVIDPFASEAERLRFLLDFYHRARTPMLMLQIDDPSGVGVSIPVPSSGYKRALKQALYYTSDTQVQDLIDSTFDAYGSNYGLTRRTGKAARTEVTFYIKTRPSTSVVIPIGTQMSGGSTLFSTTRAGTIDLGNLASTYNPTKGRYEIEIPVRANQVGAAGNVGAGQISQLTSVVTADQKVGCTNSGAAFGGEDLESNLAFTTRILAALASVDSGTAQGYLQTAADTAGVLKAEVVAAGDPLMQRDIGEDGKHHGGKVDVWVQGENSASVTDTFAFSFDIFQDIQFEVLGSPSDYTFRAVDPSLSSASPIAAMLDYPDLGYELRNISTGEVFDLTDVTITSYDTIKLSTDVVQPALDLSDVVLGAYRKASTNDFVLLRQPVANITSVVGTASGTLPETSYKLVRPDAPLFTGRSSLAKAYLSITGYEDSTGNFVPSGDLEVVTGETHVMTGQYVEYVNNLGALYFTLVVTSEDGSVIYRGPDDPSGIPDYSIDLGTQTQALGIRRTSNSAIPSGATVSFAYSHDENFTVSYTTNLIVSSAQQDLDATKHATADVLAKEAIPVPVDVSASVVLQKGQDRAQVDSFLRTNFSNLFTNMRLGNPLRQSDVIQLIENTAGVSYVVVPLTTLLRQEGSQVVREALSTDASSDSILLQSLTSNVSVVFLVTQELEAATVDGGGGQGDFKGVFQDEVEIELLEASEALTTLGLSPGRAYLIGSQGRSIQGYSDDATLTAQGYATPDSRLARRLELTANRLLVSLPVGESPPDHQYSVTYIVGPDAGPKNIVVNPTSVITQGDLTLTYDEDQ